MLTIVAIQFETFFEIFFLKINLFIVDRIDHNMSSDAAVKSTVLSSFRLRGLDLKL